MDVKPTDEFELEKKKPEENADDDFACTLPDVSEETGTSFDDYIEDPKSDLERAKTSAEIDKFYESFPEYEVDTTIRIRNKTNFSLDPDSNRLRIRDSGQFVYLSSEKKSK